MRELGVYVNGLLDASHRDAAIQRKAERWVFRVIAPDGRRVYAKCGQGRKRREVLREAENARLLAARDFGPEVVASGDRPEGAWLVTADVLPDAFFIGPLLKGMRPTFLGRDASPVRATGPSSSEVWGSPRRGVELAGEAIREFHDAGFSFPDLTATHAYLTLDRPRLWIIDAARLERHRGPGPLRARARDLGALLFSLEQSWQPLSRAGRLRLIRAASGLRDDDLRAFVRRVEVEVLRLAARTRWRHEFLWTGPRPLAGEDEVLKRFHVRPDSNWYRRVTDPRRWQVVRTLPDRTNLRLVRRGRTIFFAKSYPPSRAGRTPAMSEFEAIERFLRAGILVNRVAAYTEDVERGSMLAVHACRGEPLDDLLRRGVTAAERRVLAVQTARIWRRMRECGLRHRDAYPCHLFVAPWEDAGAAGGRAAKANGPPEGGTPNCADAAPSRLDRPRSSERASVPGTPLGVPPSGGTSLASDASCTGVGSRAELDATPLDRPRPAERASVPGTPLGVPPSGGTVLARDAASAEPTRGRAAAPRFELRLIDLTRAGPAPFPKERWFVKDAAQLWHGLPKPPVTRTDAVRWLREYFRIPKLTREAKRFARRVAAKERSIAAHVARKATRARKTRRDGTSS